MVESAFEFARICRKHDFHNFLFSMKASNPLVMVQAYRLLVRPARPDLSARAAPLSPLSCLPSQPRPAPPPAPAHAPRSHRDPRTPSSPTKR